MDNSFGSLSHGVVLLPELRSALVAGALLAFALSWDEVIVTIFTAGGNTTIPIWIWTGLRTGGSGSEINVVAAALVLLSIVPVYCAQRLTTGADGRSAAGEPSTLTATAGSQPI